MDADALLLSDTELVALTGYRRAAEQLVWLHAHGFHRAERNRLGKVTLTRAHYDAVERATQPAQQEPRRPMLKSQRVKAAA